MQVPCLLHLVVGLEVGISSHRWISHFCTPFSNASATNPILPNEESTGPNIDPLFLQILYLKMLYSEERSGFPWTEPCHRTVFSQIKELKKRKQLRHDIWFSKSTFCSIDINITKGDKGRDQIIKICKCLVLVYDGRQSKGKLYLYLNVGLS